MNKEKFSNYELVNTQKRYKKLLRKPHLIKNENLLYRCENCQDLEIGQLGECSKDENCCTFVERVKTMIYLDVPIYIGSTITEYAKLRMYEFWYELKEHYGEKIKLLMTDTDSFIVEIQAENLDTELEKFAKDFDFSNYPADHQLYNEENKKTPGKMKNEYPDRVIWEFVGLRSKCYSLKCADEKSSQTAKGIRAKRKLKHDLYKEILENKGEHYVTESVLRSYKQEIHRETHTKKALSVVDDKRVWIGQDLEPFSEGFGDTLALNHYKLVE